MAGRLEKLRWATNAVVRRMSGVDMQRSGRLQEHLRFMLEVLGERLETVDARLLRIEEKLATAPPFEDELPPTALMDLVGGAASFHLAGQTMFKNLVELAGLSKDEAVLDVGCGCGRTARHLVRYLSPQGRYCGFDIVAESVRWCRTYLSRLHQGFSFEHADIYNGLYNPAGTEASSSFDFPYEDGSFDLAFLDSVFTHMFPADVARYLDELGRVLKPGGRALLSFFVLDEASRAAMPARGTHLQFVHAGDGWFTVSPEVPESAIAYELSDVERMLEERRFKVKRRLYGSWSGRVGADVGPQQQDLFLVTT